MQRNSPHKYAIGMLDSGVGGLTVMQQVMHQLPLESIVYFGDTARVPYGGKSPETIMRYSVENAIFLMEQKIKLLIVACNTICSVHALEKIRQIFNLPVIGVIEPGAERAVRVTRNGHIAVLGTKATVLSGAYQKAIQDRMPEAHVTSIACPLFVPLVEEHFFEHPAAKIIVKEYLEPLRDQNIDTVLLGCTHYPLLAKLIQEELGDDVTVVDSASTCARTVAELISEMQLQTDMSTPQHRYVVSDDPEKFRILGRTFLGMPLENVELKSLDR